MQITRWREGEINLKLTFFYTKVVVIDLANEQTKLMIT